MEENVTTEEFFSFYGISHMKVDGVYRIYREGKEYGADPDCREAYRIATKAMKREYSSKTSENDRRKNYVTMSKNLVRKLYPSAVIFNADGLQWVRNGLCGADISEKFEKGNDDKCWISAAEIVRQAELDEDANKASVRAKTKDGTAQAICMSYTPIGVQLCQIRTGDNNGILSGEWPTSGLAWKDAAYRMQIDR